MDLVKLSALKDDGFRSMVIGAVAIIGIAPFGWLELLDAKMVYTTILSLMSIVIGKDVVGNVASAIKKSRES